MKEEVKKTTAFDSMKKLEEAKKKQLISKALTEVKKLCKSIQENKELCNMILDELDIDKKEQKQIIDWINNLSDVKPTDEVKQGIKDNAKETLRQAKTKADRNIEDDPGKYLQLISTYGDGVPSSQKGNCSTLVFNTISGTTTTAPTYLCSTKGNEITLQ